MANLIIDEVNKTELKDNHSYDFIDEKFQLNSICNLFELDNFKEYYSYETFKRALSSQNHDINEYKIITDSIDELLKSLEITDFKSKSINFLKEYFSKSRYIRRE